VSVAFRNYAAAAASVLDTIFGERFEVHPLAYSGGKYFADPDRAIVVVTAILAEKAVVSELEGHRNERAVSRLTLDHATTHAAIELKKSAAPYDLKSKDRFLRLSDRFFYEVSGVLNDDLDHVSFRVTKMGQAGVTFPDVVLTMLGGWR
jgi:hypothetical protein